MPTKRVPTLSAEQLSEVLTLMKGADSVELKLSVPDADQRSVVDALEMDPVGAQIRQVAFFDTPDLALDKVGVVVRARRIQGKPADSVVKLRPVKPAELSPALRKTVGFGVEVDAMPGGFVCSASMKGAADPLRGPRCVPWSTIAAQALHQRTNERSSSRTLRPVYNSKIS